MDLLFDMFLFLLFLGCLFALIGGLIYTFADRPQPPPPPPTCVKGEIPERVYWSNGQQTFTCLIRE